MSLKKELQSILKSERGVALMMILTAIIILMAIYGEFTFDSKISRIKATNILDKSQSKLLAESGLQLAMARLRLYKEAFNYVQGNANAKNVVSTQLLNQIWEVPFMYPIPLGENAPAGFKSTVEKFEKDTLLDGEMKVSIQNISNRLNLNLLRMDMTKYDPNKPQEEDGQLTLNDSAIQSDVSIDQALYFLLKHQVEEKKDKDPTFEDRYSNLNYQDMITNLRFYISDYQSLNSDPMAGAADSTFQKIPLTPKYGPLASASELYAIPGWNDELIELVQNEFSVYPSAQIDLNKLTANMLRILIPTINDDDIKEFFEYRDDPMAPKFFNTIDDFKKYVVFTASLMGESSFDERMKLFTAKGITFGSTPNLFKVIAEGTYNRSVYTLVAFVSLPTQSSTGGAAGGTNGGTTSGGTNGSSGGGSTGTTAGGSSGGSTGGAATQSTQLLEPRIIEIQIN